VIPLVGLKIVVVIVIVVMPTDHHSHISEFQAIEQVQYCLVLHPMFKNSHLRDQIDKYQFLPQTSLYKM